MLTEMAKFHEGYGEEEDSQARQNQQQSHIAAALPADQLGRLGRGWARRKVAHRMCTILSAAIATKISAR